MSNIFLGLMSLWFYGYYSVSFLLILLVSICINYGIGMVLYNKSHTNLENKDISSYKWILILGIISNIGFLFLCKYSNFFINNINVVFKSNISLLSIVLPLGLSFYTFQQIAYLVDSYRGETDKYSFFDYLLFVSFFAQLIEGPIVLHDEFFKELNDIKNKSVNYENLLKGFYGFTLGFSKKVLIADNLSSIVDIGYQNIGNLSGVNAFFVMLCYALQIYFDFSGYCDMAYGIGYMLNIHLPINFNSPYKAISISDFWDRWHMTLTRFFTKYIYFPLGGSRKGNIRTYINILIVFLVSGIWHGANWNFIVWGLMNGICMVIYRMGRKLFLKIPNVIMIIFTFIFDVFAWSMFRAESVMQGFEIMKQVFIGGLSRINPEFPKCFIELTEARILLKFDILSLYDKFPELMLLVFISGLLFAVFFMKNTQEKMNEYKPCIKKYIITAILMAWNIISLSNITDFIYVNF